MANIHKKVGSLLEELLYCDFRTSVGIDKAKDKIRVALKEQDRDTRHACAEAVTVSKDFELDIEECQMMDKDDVHAIIINCQGGTGVKGL